MLSWTRCAGPDFSRAPLSLLRERTSAAIWEIGGSRTATSAPCATSNSGLGRTVVWLDYPVYVSLWRPPSARTAPWRSARRPLRPVEGTDCPSRCSQPQEGCSRRSRSHRGQRREYPYVQPANQHLAVVRLRSPRATRQWIAASPRWTAAGVGTGGAVRAARRTRTAAFHATEQPRNTGFVPPGAAASSSWRSDSLSRALYGGVLPICRTKASPAAQSGA